MPEPADGEAVLRVDRVGMTANNVTYAVLGDVVPLLGVLPGRARARGAGAAVGLRRGGRVRGRTASRSVSASTATCRPRATSSCGPAGSTRRGLPRRQPSTGAALPSPYNAYALTTGDPAYEADREDLQVLFRPLFFTSFMLADQLADDESTAPGRWCCRRRRARRRTATAFLLRGAGAEVVGLTVAGQRRVHRVARLLRPGAVVRRGRRRSAAGPDRLRRPRRQHAAAPGAARATCASDLVLDLVVGVTHQDGTRAGHARRRPADGLLRARPDGEAHGRLGPRGARRALRRGLAALRPDGRGLGRRHGLAGPGGAARRVARGARRAQRPAQRATSCSCRRQRPRPDAVRTGSQCWGDYAAGGIRTCR